MPVLLRVKGRERETEKGGWLMCKVSRARKPWRLVVDFDIPSSARGPVRTTVDWRKPGRRADDSSRHSSHNGDWIS